MKKITRFVAFVLLFVTCVGLFPVMKADAASSMNIMTYNLKNTNYSYSKITSMIKSASADIVGMQEVTQLQEPGMTTAMALSGYGIVKGMARGTNSWKEGNEFNPIYYKKSKVSVYASGTFWLSDTPTKKSKLSGSSYYRICTWACFQVKGKQEFILVFNTHLDFSEAVKAKQLKVIMEHAVALESKYFKAKNHIVILGDLNSYSSTNVCKYLQGDAKCAGMSNNIMNQRLDNARDVSKGRTANKWGNYYTQPSSKPTGDIDHIYITVAGLTCNTFQVLNNAAGSDHLPVVAKLTLK